MAEEKVYKIVIARPAQIRFQQRVLPYIYENFSFKRAIEIDENILVTAATLVQKSLVRIRLGALKDLIDFYQVFFFKVMWSKIVGGISLETKQRKEREIS